MINIRAFRAVDEIETCNEYVRGHVQVLKDFGIESITSNNFKWLQNPNMYCFIATDETGKMVGGIRIQVADGIFPLPVEEAVGKMDSHIYKLIQQYAIYGGVGELCGLWNSREVKGIGVSVILVRAAISAINQLKFNTLSGICAEYSLKMFQNVGFVINDTLGSNGTFIYPNENYIARVVGILDGGSLIAASDYDRERMISLREKPVQVRSETGPKGEFMVNYDLTVKNVNTIVLPDEYTLRAAI